MRGEHAIAVAIEPLDLKAAAAKVDEATGEITEFAKKARAGRVVAAMYELTSAIRWACAKARTAVIDLTAETASTCSICGGFRLAGHEEDNQTVRCDDCGAELDRKRNAAAVAWQFVFPLREELIVDYHAQVQDAVAERAAKATTARLKMAEERALARERKG